MSIKNILTAKTSHKIMHVVEGFGGGVAHSVSQIYNKYTEDIDGVLVYGKRDLNEALIGTAPRVKYLQWIAEREINLLNDFKALLQLLKYIDEERPSLIHCHSSKAGVIGRIAAFLKGVPCVYTPHSYSFLRLDVSKGHRFLYRFIEKILSRFATTVACGLEEFKIAKSLGGDVEIVENGVDLDLFKPLEISNFAKFPTFTFLCVGRLAPQKDFGFFELLAKRSEFSGCQFIWVTGEGHADYSLSDRVFVYGKRSPVELVKIIQMSHCFLSTSLWEGLSRAVIEGAACGLPLLLRNCPGNREIIFRPLVVYSFENLEDCVSMALEIMRNYSSDPFFGLSNSIKVKSFYDSAKTQSRIRSIYDATVFGRISI